jgi:hypothetical protein
MFRNLIRLLILMTLVTGLSSVSFAKDLTNRLGVGYTDQFSTNLPSIAARYYPDPKFGFSAALGVDTQKDESRFGFMLKAYRIIFMEDNLNFYMGAGAGVLSREIAGNNKSGFELSGFGGAEFFFAGLENLGFSFETGIAITSISSETRFRTLADHPLKAGIIFYF